MEHPGKIPMYQRIITTHNAEGKSVFATDVGETASIENAMDNDSVVFSLTYSTTEMPVQLHSNKDLDHYKIDLKEPPGIARQGAAVIWTTDTAPGYTTVMHRTVSLDCGVVISGQVELKLDSGETRNLKPGDVCVQRGTMHSWRNTSETEWLRMMFFIQSIEPLTINGKELTEDLGGVTDAKGVYEG